MVHFTIGELFYCHHTYPENWNPEDVTNSLVSGGHVSRVNPESTGLNPAWRKSLAFMLIATAWRDGANSTEIAAARALLVQDMKLLEGIAPESGAYFNEVKKSPSMQT